MNKALETWREKLEYPRQQEAIAADPAQKFAVKKRIEEAQKLADAKQSWQIG